MSRLHGWKPKPKFTAGLNVSQDEWDRIFGKKWKVNPEYETATYGMKPPDEPLPRQSSLTKPSKESNSKS